MGGRDQVVRGCRSRGGGNLGCPALLSLWADTSLCDVPFVALGWGAAPLATPHPALPSAS